jgi:protein-disulfide isomerase
MTETKKIELSPALAIVIAGVIIAGAIVFTRTQPVDAGKALAALGNAAAINIRPPTADDYRIGAQDAPVVIVEYSDFQCPYCNLINPTLRKIVGESNGSIAWVYRHLPLTSMHPEAEPAANAAECVGAQLGQEGFWKFADQIFSNQQSMSSAYYVQTAQSLGADMAAYTQCVAKQTYQHKVTADSSEATSNGANGTPFVVVINTKTGKTTSFAGALPYAQIMAAVRSVQ